MTQMASLLAVATVFVAFWTLNIYILQSEQGGLYARQNYLCRNLSQKCRGGLYARGGVFAGFYGIDPLQLMYSFASHGHVTAAILVYHARACCKCIRSTFSCTI